MKSRISKFTPVEQKRLVLLIAKVPVRHRAIYVSFLNLADSDMSEDLRAYLAATVKRIERTVSELPKAQQAAFWQDVEDEQAKVLRGKKKLKVLRRAA